MTRFVRFVGLTLAVFAYGVLLDALVNSGFHDAMATSALVHNVNMALVVGFLLSREAFDDRWRLFAGIFKGASARGR